MDESPPATTYKLTRVDCQSCRPEELLQQELGDVAVDCGEFGFFRPDSGAIECVDAQLDAGTSFVVYGRPVGIDAEFIEAYVRASDGGFRMVLFGEGGADMKCFGQSSLYRCSGFTTDDGGVTCVGQLSDGQCTESHSRVEYDGGARPLSELRCYNDRYCWADPGHHGVEPDGGQRLSCIEAPFGPGSVTCSSDSPSCPVDTGHYPGGMQEDAG